jgi:hypothetical protein
METWKTDFPLVWLLREGIPAPRSCSRAVHYPGLEHWGNTVEAELLGGLFLLAGEKAL